MSRQSPSRQIRRLAPSKRSGLDNFNVSITWRILAFFVFISTQSLIPTAWAQVCYSDAKVAYERLMITEKRQTSVDQARIDEAWVNINTATEAQLTTLDGIGAIKAQEIILYRDMFGAFDSVDNLTEVRGIGEKTVEKNRHRLRVD